MKGKKKAKVTSKPKQNESKEIAQKHKEGTFGNQELSPSIL
jgi:hypothetical protein